MPTATQIAIELPVAYQTAPGRIAVLHEEDALCWFWAYPELLPWPAPVRWLYTPVTGNRHWPGDLWGVDQDGELLILECKQCRRRSDAFLDFVDYHCAGREEFTADHWLAKWQKHLKAELAFATSTIERPPGQTAGLLPRSNKRAHIRRWPVLAARIDAHIRSAGYLDAVKMALKRRNTRLNPAPHYFALMVVSDAAPILTASAVDSGRALKQMVGAQHVHVISTQAEVRLSGGVLVSARMEHLP